MIQIIIPNYLKRVKISEARRAKYYTPTDDLPDKYRDTKLYRWLPGKDGKIYLQDRLKKEFVVMNSRSAGTPGYQSIAGNEIYARMHERKRMVIVDALKKQFKEHISKQVSHIPDDIFPISVQMILQSPFGMADWDLDNLWIYHKCFLDSLRDLELIPDDNVLYIRQAGQTTLIPVKEGQTPHMIFRITEAPKESLVPAYGMVRVTESSKGEPGDISINEEVVTIYTGKKKILFGAAKDAVRKLMFYALNNFMTVFVPKDIYLRYEKFFHDFQKYNVKYIIIE